MQANLGYTGRAKFQAPNFGTLAVGLKSGLQPLQRRPGESERVNLDIQSRRNG